MQINKVYKKKFCFLVIFNILSKKRWIFEYCWKKNKSPLVWYRAFISSLVAIYTIWILLKFLVAGISVSSGEQQEFNEERLDVRNSLRQPNSNWNLCSRMNVRLNNSTIESGGNENLFAM